MALLGKFQENVICTCYKVSAKTYYGEGVNGKRRFIVTFIFSAT